MAILTEEHLLLTKSEATAILQSHGRLGAKVIRCCDDGAVLFVNRMGKHWTAWMSRDDGVMVVEYEEGWPVAYGTAKVSPAHRIPLDRKERVTK